MKKAIIIIFTSLIVLSGCGQTGPLYLPEKNTSDKKDPAPVDKDKTTTQSKKSS